MKDRSGKGSRSGPLAFKIWNAQIHLLLSHVIAQLNFPEGKRERERGRSHGLMDTNYIFCSFYTYLKTNNSLQQIYAHSNIFRAKPEISGLSVVMRTDWVLW